MRRREFISLVGGAVAAWPRAVTAQVSPKRALVAVLSSISSTTAAHWSGFSQGLRELGYVEGRNFDIVYRYADGVQEPLPLLADELVRLKPDVIVTGSTDATLAVKQATGAIPIVCSVLTDPVAFGLVESQARPGGQVTGILSASEGLQGKRLQTMGIAPVACLTARVASVLPVTMTTGTSVTPNALAAVLASCW
jgi:putative ABC transport system substrate-binding protein